MSYIQIELAGLPVTEDQQRDLLTRTIGVMAGRRPKDPDSVRVSIKDVGTSTERDKSASVNVHVSSQTTSAADRAKLTWAMIEMLKDVLGNKHDAAYEVIITCNGHRLPVSKGRPAVNLQRHMEASAEIPRPSQALRHR